MFRTHITQNTNLNPPETIYNNQLNSKTLYYNVVSWLNALKMKLQLFVLFWFKYLCSSCCRWHIVSYILFAISWQIEMTYLPALTWIDQNKKCYGNKGTRFNPTTFLSNHHDLARAVSVVEHTHTHMYVYLFLCSLIIKHRSSHDQHTFWGENNAYTYGILYVYPPQ